MDVLEAIANLASILTAIAAVCVVVGFAVERRTKRLRLEQYLRKEEQAHPDQSKRSLLHLVARVGLTEDEVLQASFRSNRVKRVIHVDKVANLADELLFEYRV